MCKKVEIPETLPQPPSKRNKRDDYPTEWCDIDAEDEISSYLNQNPGDDSDVLQWWSSRVSLPFHSPFFFVFDDFTDLNCIYSCICHQVTQFPKLSQIAREVLCIPATSASSERVFSDGGTLVSARRTGLTPDSIDNILFLHKYFKEAA